MRNVLICFLFSGFLITSFSACSGHPIDAMQLQQPAEMSAVKRALEQPNGELTKQMSLQALRYHQRQESLFSTYFQDALSSPALQSMIEREGVTRTLPTLLTSFSQQTLAKLRACIQEQPAPRSNKGPTEAFHLSLSCMGVGSGRIEVTLYQISTESLLDALSKVQTSTQGIRLQGEIRWVLQDACVNQLCATGQMITELDITPQKADTFASYHFLLSKGRDILDSLLGGIRYEKAPQQPGSIHQLLLLWEVIDPSEFCPKLSNAQSFVARFEGEYDEQYRTFSLFGANGSFVCSMKNATQGTCNAEHLQSSSPPTKTP